MSNAEQAAHLLQPNKICSGWLLSVPGRDVIGCPFYVDGPAALYACTLLNSCAEKKHVSPEADATG